MKLFIQFSLVSILSFSILNVFADSLSFDTLLEQDSVVESTLQDTTIADSTITLTESIIIPPTPFEEATSGNNALIALVLVLITLIIMFVLKSVGKSEIDKKEGLFSERLEELSTEANLINKVLLILLLTFISCYFTWFYIRGTMMESHVVEWLNLLVRWAHVVAGIMWIGASFYFIFLENSLNRTKNLREEIAGDLWAVHGGGFYYLEKYKLAPGKIPKELHWFKYEAYFTWITGFALLWIVYYMNASVYMIDPEVMDIAPGTAVFIGLATLFVTWFLYDGLCKSPVGKRPLAFAIVGFIIVTAISYLLCQVLSPRAAYIHVGAMIGTWMVGNVFMVIIPSQKAMVKAAKENKPLDPNLGINAGLRSLHNNYLTLPVIFIMISNHFPSTYGFEYNWAILAALSLISAVVKHYWNLLEMGNNLIWILPLVAISIIALVIITAPKSNEDMLKNADPVSFSQIREVFDNRCTTCHSANPTDEVWKTAPNRVMFDNPEQIVKLKDKILNRAVITKTMPQANKSGMLQEERDLIEIWIYQGAQVDEIN